METEIEKLILATKTELQELCSQLVWKRTQPIFEQHPTLIYFHYAKHGEDKQDRYLAVNGIRWEDLEYFLRARDFETSQLHTLVKPMPHSEVRQCIVDALGEMPDFKALRAAIEDLYHVLLNLTNDGFLNILADGPFRIIATKEGEVIIHPLSSNEMQSYPSNTS